MSGRPSPTTPASGSTAATANRRSWVVTTCRRSSWRVLCVPATSSSRTPTTPRAVTTPCSLPGQRHAQLGVLGRAVERDEARPAAVTGRDTERRCTGGRRHQRRRHGQPRLSAALARLTAATLRGRRRQPFPPLWPRGVWFTTLRGGGRAVS